MQCNKPTSNMPVAGCDARPYKTRKHTGAGAAHLPAVSPADVEALPPRARSEVAGSEDCIDRFVLRHARLYLQFARSCATRRATCSHSAGSCGAEPSALGGDAIAFGSGERRVSRPQVWMWRRTEGGTLQTNTALAAQRRRIGRVGLKLLRVVTRSPESCMRRGCARVSAWWVVACVRVLRSRDVWI
jgi:hypothetical protein